MGRGLRCRAGVRCVVLRLLKRARVRIVRRFCSCALGASVPVVRVVRSVRVCSNLVGRTPCSGPRSVVGSRLYRAYKVSEHKSEAERPKTKC